MNREARAGIRRHSGSDVGTEYQRWVAHYGEGEARDPDVSERTLGDFLDPYRSASVVECVNLAAREVGPCVESWPVGRVVGLVGGVVRERREMKQG